MIIAVSIGTSTTIFTPGPEPGLFGTCEKDRKKTMGYDLVWSE